MTVQCALQVVVHEDNRYMAGVEEMPHQIPRLGDVDGVGCDDFEAMCSHIAFLVVADVDIHAALMRPVGGEMTPVKLAQVSDIARYRVGVLVCKLFVGVLNHSNGTSGTPGFLGSKTHIPYAILELYSIDQQWIVSLLYPDFVAGVDQPLGAEAVVANQISCFHSIPLSDRPERVARTNPMGHPQRVFTRASRLPLGSRGCGANGPRVCLETLPRSNKVRIGDPIVRGQLLEWNVFPLGDLRQCVTGSYGDEVPSEGRSRVGGLRCYQQTEDTNKTGNTTTHTVFDARAALQ